MFPCLAIINVGFESQDRVPPPPGILNLRAEWVVFGLSVLYPVLLCVGTVILWFNMCIEHLLIGLT